MKGVGEMEYMPYPTLPKLARLHAALPSHLHGRL